MDKKDWEVVDSITRMVLPSTYWNYEIRVGDRCVMSAGDAALSTTLSRAIADAVYYKAVYPAEKITIAGIRESCGRCHNNLTIAVHKPRSTRIVRCPVCKGKGATGTLADIPFVMPDPANRIILAQGA